MAALSSVGEATGAIAHGRDIVASSYTMHDGPVLRSLEEAARRGAHVEVHIEGKPFGSDSSGLARQNQRVVDELKSDGADASLDHPIHAKTIAVDGTRFYDCRNWGAGDFVIRDDGRDAFATSKREALAREATLLDTAAAGDRPIVESESFGTGNPVYSALDALGRRGCRPRLLVSARQLRGKVQEAKVLARLQHDGVEVRVCEDSEKFALAGDRAWAGSANASVDCRPGLDMTDWGVCTRDRSIVEAVRARIEARWNGARAL